MLSVWCIQLKSIIRACTELKYQEEDIYQLNSVDISRVLRQLNENNNRLIDQKSENSSSSAPSTPSPSPVVTSTGATEPEANLKPVALFASAGSCQLFRVPRQLGIPSVVSSTEASNTLPSLTSVNNDGERVHRLDHAYTAQSKDGSLRPSSVVVVLKSGSEVIDRAVGSGNTEAGSTLAR
jgi:hypothetical protein